MSPMVAGDSDSSRFLDLERGRGGFMDVGEWLRNLGLGKYEPEFIENAIDLDVLPELTEDDLEKLGMPIGDRKRFIRAIKATATNSPSLPISEIGQAQGKFSPVTAAGER